MLLAAQPISHEKIVTFHQVWAEYVVWVLNLDILLQMNGVPTVSTSVFVKIWILEPKYTWHGNW